MTHTTITLDALNDQRLDFAVATRGRLDRYVVEMTTGAHAEILTATYDETTGRTRGFAKFTRTGLLVEYVTTGGTDRRGATLRVRVRTARDTGDLAGTLVFDGDAEDGTAIRGHVNVNVRNVAQRLARAATV